MKTRSFILAVILLITLMPSQMVSGQPKSREDQNREEAIRKSIDAQKKSMAVQQKNMDDQSKKIQMKVDEGLISEQEAKIELESARKEYEVLKSNLEDGMKFEIRPNGRRDSSTRVYSINRNVRGLTYGGDPFIFGDFYGRMGGDSDRTTWDLSKSIKEGTFSKEYTFDVDKATKSFIMSVNGDCKSGEFRIKILLPGGKSYSDMLIDEFGNINIRKSFNISDTENQDKTGTWKFQVSSTKATGFFKISLQTF